MVVLGGWVFLMREVPLQQVPPAWMPGLTQRGGWPRLRTRNTQRIISIYPQSAHAVKFDRKEIVLKNKV